MAILKSENNHYKIEKKIDEGTYGIVYKATKIETSEKVALKLIKSQTNPEFLNEIQILKKLKHKNIINLLEVFKHKNQTIIVYEYMKMNLLNYYESFDKKVP